jgi:hypothetical protein
MAQIFAGLVYELLVLGGSSYGPSKGRCQEEVADGPWPVCQWDNPDGICNSRCIQTCECDPLKKPDNEKRPERMEQDQGNESESKQDSAPHHNESLRVLEENSPHKESGNQRLYADSPDEDAYLSHWTLTS